MATKARFKGDGSAFHEGIPARDLSEEEYDELTTEQKATVRSSELYDVRSEREMHPPKAAESAPARKDGEG